VLVIRFLCRVFKAGLPVFFVRDIDNAGRLCRDKSNSHVTNAIACVLFFHNLICTLISHRDIRDFY